MNRNIFNLGWMGCAVVLLAGCTSSKTESWVNPAFEEHSIGKTIVIAQFEDKFISQQFEVLFAEHLLSYVSAASLRADVKDADQLNKDTLQKLLKEYKVDTIVLTHVLATTDRSQLEYEGGGVTAVTYAGYSDHYAYCCSSYGLDTGVDSFMECVLETTLFDVKTDTVMWSGRKSVYDFDAKESNMKEVIQEVIWDLENDGMLTATYGY